MIPESSDVVLKLPPRIRSAERCRIRARRTGKQCENKEIVLGGGVCWKHGGTQRSFIHKWIRVTALEIMTSTEKPPEIIHTKGNPFEIMAQVLDEILYWKNICADKVDELEEWRWKDEHGGEQLHSYLALYERALDRAKAMVVATSKLNIEERYYRLSERQANMMMWVAVQFIKRMGIGPDREEEARALMTELFMEVMSHDPRQSKNQITP